MFGCIIAKGIYNMFYLLLWKLYSYIHKLNQDFAESKSLHQNGVSLPICVLENTEVITESTSTFDW